MIAEVSIRCQKTPEVGIRRIPAYTPQYTTVCSGKCNELWLEILSSSLFASTRRSFKTCCVFRAFSKTHPTIFAPQIWPGWLACLHCKCRYWVELRAYGTEGNYCYYYGLQCFDAVGCVCVCVCEHMAALTGHVQWCIVVGWHGYSTKFNQKITASGGGRTWRTHTRLMALFLGLPGWASTRKVEPIWILLKQETVSGSGICWAICKSAPRSRQITTPALHHSVFFTGLMPFLLPNQQRQSTEGNWQDLKKPINNDRWEFADIGWPHRETGIYRAWKSSRPYLIVFF